MTPDVYDVNGKLYHGPERRAGEPRRDEDPSPEVRRGVEFFVRMMIVNKGKVIALCSAIAAGGGYMAGCGGRIHDLDAVKGDVKELRGEVNDLKDGQKLGRYIACVSVPSNAPVEAHRLCDDIIRKGVTP